MRGDDLADAEGGGLALNAGDVGDGVGEFSLRRPVLGRQRKRFQPFGDVLGVRHRGIRGDRVRVWVWDGGENLQLLRGV